MMNYHRAPSGGGEDNAQRHRSHRPWPTDDATSFLLSRDRTTFSPDVSRSSDVVADPSRFVEIAKIHRPSMVLTSRRTKHVA